MFNFCKFRCGGHRLPVATGRWHNVSRAVRFCHLCDSADIGDEFHYIMSCNHLKQEREKYLPSYCYNNANTFKCNELCCLCNIVVLEKLCKFIKIIKMKVPPPGYCNCNFFHTCTKLNMLYVIVYFSVTLCIWFKRIKYMHSFIHSFSNSATEYVCHWKSVVVTIHHPCIPKFTTAVFNVEEACHSTNTLLTMVHDQTRLL